MEIRMDGIKKNITKAADYTIKKTEKLARTAKLELRSAKLKSRLNQYYARLGKIKYMEMTGTQIDPSAFEKVAERIENLQLAIDSTEAELAQLRAYRLCIGCSAHIANDVVFCPKCGTRQEPLEEEETANAIEE